MCFEKFDDFYTKLKDEFKAEKGDKAESYENKIKMVEKLLKIDLQKDFFSWIGSEISYVKLKPTANGKEEDMLIVINTNDIESAKSGLGHMMEQIRKRTPVKFKTQNYNNYDINYLEIKGFFKMFFGKLFGKLEKPYFTCIKDYVVFSNNPSIIMDVIDDYSAGKTLVNNKDFADFKDEFEVNSNVTAFVETPNAYSYLYNYSNADKRKGVKKNKEVILCFTKVGFQLISDGNVFKTTIITGFNNNYKGDELERIESSAEDTYNKECEALSFKVNATGNDGNYKETYSDGKPKCDGTISGGKLNGQLKSFYESGNLKSVVNYKDGKVEGNAVFYYDNANHIIKAEVIFENELIKGDYKEYYENTKPKAVIEYNNGKPDGDAKYYYDSGNIKIEASFKEGEQNGKWKIYNETGQMTEKQKWKKGEKK
jgi:antitoxin component YwqK of YwqJK toxin-antitoxin module